MDERGVVREIKIQTFALLIQQIAGENPPETKLQEAKEKAQRFYAAARLAASE